MTKTIVNVKGKSQYLGALILIIGFTFLFHISCLVAGKTFLADWRWPNEPVHSSIEMGGAIIALLVASVLMRLERRSAGTSFNYMIAAALIGMGLLDGAHAIVPAGNTFVWLHSLAVLTGGILFATVWIPESKLYIFGRHKFPFIIGGVVLIISICSLVFDNYNPVMVIGEEFTLTAKVLNITGGAFFFSAAVRLVLVYRKRRKVDDFLFFLHCFLFGAAAVMFEQSSLWDAPWWGWHILRMIAYVVALLFVIHSQQESETDYLKSKDDSLKDVRIYSEKQERLNAELQNLKNDLEEKNMELVSANDKQKSTHEQLMHAEKLSAIGKLSASIAHEFNNPICGIRNVLESVANDDFGEEDEEEKNRLLKMAIRECDRIAKLVTNLGDFNRPSAGVKVSVNIETIIDDVILMCKKKLSAREIEVEIKHET
ncbi:MAG: histidine kinase dimerization/phospho-acceptor domain-containing protein, partial [Candidatus Anammoxibacter sp.]